jgi:hypothetical protein
MLNLGFVEDGISTQIYMKRKATAVPSTSMLRNAFDSSEDRLLPRGAPSGWIDEF